MNVEAMTEGDTTVEGTVDTTSQARGTFVLANVAGYNESLST
jgi:hypothetical protein